jgi:hypothetical protein
VDLMPYIVKILKSIFVVEQTAAKKYNIFPASPAEELRQTEDWQ